MNRTFATAISAINIASAIDLTAGVDLETTSAIDLAAATGLDIAASAAADSPLNEFVADLKAFSIAINEEGHDAEYYFINRRKTWQGAKDLCSKFGLTLATFKTEDSFSKMPRIPDV